MPDELLQVIRSFPARREVEHCGVRFTVDAFDFYAQCPQCGTRLKLRAFSAGGELEDVFDAVFEWINQPGATEIALRRQQALEADE